MMRYQPIGTPIKKYIGGVDQFDIYLSRAGTRYVVRWGDYGSVRFYVHDGVPSPETLIAKVVAIRGEHAYDQAVRVSKMIELINQP